MKGSVLDIMLIVIIFTIFAIAALFTNLFLTSFQTPFENVVTNQQARDTIQSGINLYNGLDQVIVLVLFGSFIVVLILSFLVDTHPIFLVFSILFLIFVVISTAQLANLYIAFAQTDTFAAVASNYTITLAVFTNLPLIVTVMGIVIIIALYGRTRSNSFVGA